MSLAFADLLVSVLVMPFGAIELIHQNWIYGETFCLVRTSLDVLLTTASILHLCCISLDRWDTLTHAYTSLWPPSALCFLPGKHGEACLKMHNKSLRYFQLFLRGHEENSIISCCHGSHAVFTQKSVGKSDLNFVKICVCMMLLFPWWLWCDSSWLWCIHPLNQTQHWLGSQLQSTWYF